MMTFSLQANYLLLLLGSFIRSRPLWDSQNSRRDFEGEGIGDFRFDIILINLL